MKSKQNCFDFIRRMADRVTQIQAQRAAADDADVADVDPR